MGERWAWEFPDKQSKKKKKSFALTHTDPQTYSHAHSKQFNSAGLTTAYVAALC